MWIVQSITESHARTPEPRQDADAPQRARTIEEREGGIEPGPGRERERERESRARALPSFRSGGRRGGGYVSTYIHV